MSAEGIHTIKSVNTKSDDIFLRLIKSPDKKVARSIPVIMHSA